MVKFLQMFIKCTNVALAANVMQLCPVGQLIAYNCQITNNLQKWQKL